MNRIEQLAREQVCGGNEPRTPYEKGAVQALVSFARRVLADDSFRPIYTLDGQPMHRSDCYCELCKGGGYTSQ